MPEDEKPKGIAWSNINIGLKEFLAAMVFVVSMSGVYYNLYYKQDAIRVDLQSKISALEAELAGMKKQIGTNADNVRALQDDKTARDAVDNASRNQPRFVPMQRIK